MGVQSGVDEGGFFDGEDFLAGDAVGVGGEEFLEDESGDIDTTMWVSGEGEGKGEGDGGTYSNMLRVL